MLVTLSLLLIMQAAEALAPAPPFDPGPVTCGAPFVDVDTVADVREAPPGAVWWLRQADFGSRLQGQLELRDVDGNRLIALGVRRTNASVSLQVPFGVVGGEVFDLLENGLALGVQLIVSSPPGVVAPPATLDDATPTTSEFVACPEAFCSASGSVPRVVALEVTYQGGPVILDVAATDPELPLTDITIRNIDTMLLPFVDTPTTIHVQAGPGRSQSVAVDVHVRLTSPESRTVVAEQLLVLASIDDPLDGVPLPLCGNNGFPRGGCTTGPFGCGTQCPPFAALLLIPLALRRRWQRLLRFG